MELEEKLFAVTGGLLAGALVFLTTDTVHPYACIAIVVLLTAATGVAAWQWRNRLHYDRRVDPFGTPPMRWIAMLLGPAALIALVGYVVTALQEEEPFETPPPVVPPQVIVSGADSAQTYIGWWFLLAAGLGVAAIVAFWNKKRALGTSLAVASLTMGGVTIVKMDHFIDKLQFEIVRKVREHCKTCPPAPPPGTAEPFTVVATDVVAPFAPGRADLSEAQKTHIRISREQAKASATIAFAVVVGHVDRRALKPATANEYASNQGLALQRALAVRTVLGEDLAAITTLGGPSKTRMPVTEPDLESDRRVEVFYFGTRH